MHVHQLYRYILHTSVLATSSVQSVSPLLIGYRFFHIDPDPNMLPRLSPSPSYVTGATTDAHDHDGV